MAWYDRHLKRSLSVDDASLGERGRVNTRKLKSLERTVMSAWMVTMGSKRNGIVDAGNYFESRGKHWS